MIFASHRTGAISSKAKSQFLYTNGQQETILAGDIFYWPPGHTVKVSKAAEIILFSPQAQHCEVVNHIKNQLQPE